MKKTVRLTAVIMLAAMLVGIMSACVGGIPEGAEECRACHGKKICSVCDGDGVLEMGGLLGKDRQCSFCSRNPGYCRTCNGKGYVFLR